MKGNIRTIAVCSTVALAVAAVPGQAAVRHLITGKDVKNNSLTSADVKNLSLHAKDFDKKVQKALKVRATNGVNGATGARGATGAQGANGARGATGAQGATGATGATGAAGAIGAAGSNGSNGKTPVKGVDYTDGVNGNNGLSAYLIWEAQDGNAGKTEDQFLASLKGDKGDTGVGIKSVTKVNGDWLITYTDDTIAPVTVHNGQDGDNGLSAYQDWLLLNAWTKDEHPVTEFLASLKGADGKGLNGKSAYDLWMDEGHPGYNAADTPSVGDFMITLHGQDGARGHNAWQVWQDNGHDGGSFKEFMESLKGEKGDPGDPGDPGGQGPVGPAGAQGPQGRVGPQGGQGVAGPQGRSAWEDYVANGGDLSLPEWLASLHGKQGDSIVGPQGDVGPRGPVGPQGGRGPQGETGPKGDSVTGPQGIPGPQGKQGETGPQGPAISTNSLDADVCLNSQNHVVAFAACNSGQKQTGAHDASVTMFIKP